MSEIGSGNVVPLREGMMSSEHLAMTARDLFEKHWPAIDHAGEDNGEAFAALEAEANEISAQLKLSPDAIKTLSQLIVAEFKAHSHRKLAREGVENFWRTLVSVGQSCSSAVQAQAKAAELEHVIRSGIPERARVVGREATQIRAIDSCSRRSATRRVRNNPAHNTPRRSVWALTSPSRRAASLPCSRAMSSWYSAARPRCR